MLVNTMSSESSGTLRTAACTRYSSATALASVPTSDSHDPAPRLYPAKPRPLSLMYWNFPSSPRRRRRTPERLSAITLAWMTCDCATLARWASMAAAFACRCARSGLSAARAGCDDNITADRTAAARRRIGDELRTADIDRKTPGLWIGAGVHRE